MTGEQPFVSVVIPHLNQLDAAGRCLRSLYAQDYPRHRFEIILVDNGSSCDLTPLVEAHPDVTVLSEPTPGPGPARNRGVAAARGELLAFIDADCRAHPGWLSAAVRELTSPASRGVAGGDVRIDFVDERRLTPLEAYEAVFAYRQKLYIEKKGFSGTGNLAIRRPVYDQVGPFAGIELAEDLDWGTRARRAGHAARYVPGMIVYHPARTRMSDLETKWRRHVSHDLAEHRARARPMWLWQARAVAVLLSALPHMLKLFTSDRLSGFGNRLRGAGALLGTRAFRFAEMLRQPRERGESAAARWNRGSA